MGNDYVFRVARCPSFPRKEALPNGDTTRVAFREERPQGCTSGAPCQPGHGNIIPQPAEPGKKRVAKGSPPNGPRSQDRALIRPVGFPYHRKGGERPHVGALVGPQGDPGEGPGHARDLWAGRKAWAVGARAARRGPA